jgi:hypothetical protein
MVERMSDQTSIDALANVAPSATSGLSSATLAGQAAITAILDAFTATEQPIPQSSHDVSFYAPVTGYPHAVMKQIYVQGWKAD